MDMSSIPRLHLDDVYVVVAAYCEPGVITETVARWSTAFRMVVVDDGSPDATAKRASRAAPLSFGILHLVREPRCRPASRTL
jgi:glycosyltransferase involved in cell wall biosynthesis